LPETRRVALVVDDEPPIRKLLTRLLQRRGFDVLEADTGEAALGLAARGPLRLVLCDVRMPGMSGVELYHALSQSRDDDQRHFVFITGDLASVTTEDPGLDGVAVLAKPFTAADLDALLDRLNPGAAEL
jgi:CheY-like chemotaxis protein